MTTSVCLHVAVDDGGKLNQAHYLAVRQGVATTPRDQTGQAQIAANRGTERQAKDRPLGFFLTISGVSRKIGPPEMFTQIVKDPMAELMR